MRAEADLGTAGAMAASEADPDKLGGQLKRNFGIWREPDRRGTIEFDLIFARGLMLPAAGEPPLQRERVYQPAHNIGRMRYLECSQLDEKGQPAGEIVNWEQIHFPFDPGLRQHPDLSMVLVALLAHPEGLRVREGYTCDASGTVRVRISAEPGGFAREYSVAASARE